MALLKKDKSTRRTTRRPPPNYLSRAMQRRLLLAVGSLMLVLILIVEARKPRNWQWMWAGEGTRVKQIDTRLPAKSAANDAPGTVYANVPQDLVPTVDEPLLAAEDAVDTFRGLAWAYCLERLSHDERLALDQLLKTSRQPTDGDQINSEGWQEAFSQLDETWNNYLKDVNQEVLLSKDTLPLRQQQVWLDALLELEVEWSHRLKPALRAALDERPWTEPQRNQLAGLQAILDRLSLENIQDNTVWRAAEQHAWFRLLEQLQQTNLQELGRLSEGTASFIQLYRQPREYRGKLVTVRGRAKLAYRVSAPSNIHGIDSYYIFWLQPAGGQKSPLVVYALETPRGFPTIKDKYLDGETTSLNEDVAFDGYFFKSWAYRAQDGVNTAPLLLAKAPVWQPPTKPVARPPLPGMLMATLSVGGVLGLSIGLAYLAHTANNRPVGGAVLARYKTSRHPLPAFSVQELGSDDSDQLRQIADRDHGDKST